MKLKRPRVTVANVATDIRLRSAVNVWSILASSVTSHRQWREYGCTSASTVTQTYVLFISAYNCRWKSRHVPASKSSNLFQEY